MILRTTHFRALRTLDFAGLRTSVPLVIFPWQLHRTQRIKSIYFIDPRKHVQSTPPPSRCAVGIEVLGGVHRASTRVLKRYRRLVKPVLCSPAVIKLQHVSPRPRPRPCPHSSSTNLPSGLNHKDWVTCLSGSFVYFVTIACVAPGLCKSWPYVCCAPVRIFFCKYCYCLRLSFPGPRATLFQVSSIPHGQAELPVVNTSRLVMMYIPFS